MKTRYQYITFVKQAVDPRRKTTVWTCLNRHWGDKLGEVRWYGSWRQYVFFATAEGAVYSAGCLADIQDFIAQLMKAREAG